MDYNLKLNHTNFMLHFLKWAVTRRPHWYVPTGNQNDAPQSVVLKPKQQFVSSFWDLESKYNSYYAIKLQRRSRASTSAIKQQRPPGKLMQLGKLDLSTVYRSKFLSCIGCGCKRLNLYTHGHTPMHTHTVLECWLFLSWYPNFIVKISLNFFKSNVNLFEQKFYSLRF